MKFRLILLLLANLFLVNTLFSQENIQNKIKEMLYESEYDIKQKDFDQMLATMLPIIEEVCQRKFKTKPKVVISDRKMISSILKKELNKQLTTNRDGEPKVPSFQIDILADAFAIGLIGKFTLESKSIHILPKNFNSIFKLFKIKKSEERDIIRIIMAHEIVHALQDQQVDLFKFMTRYSSIEKRTAGNCITEGHAVYFSELVAKKLKIDHKVISQMNRIIGNDFKFDDPAMDMLIKVTTEQFKIIYLGGRDFIKHHAVKDGVNVAWKMFENPPLSTSEILAPERYGLVIKNKADILKIIKSVENLFMPKVKIANYHNIGASALSGIYRDMGQPTKGIVIKSMKQCHGFIKTDGVKARSLFITEFDDQLKGDDFLKALIEMVESNVKKIQKSPTIKDCKFTKFNFLKWPKKVTHKIVLEYNASGIDYKMNFVRHFHKNYFIEFMYMDDEIKNETIEKILSNICKKL